VEKDVIYCHTVVKYNDYVTEIIKIRQRISAFLIKKERIYLKDNCLKNIIN